MSFYQVREVVGELRSKDVKEDKSPVVDDHAVVSEESVFPFGVASERLHD